MDGVLIVSAAVAKVMISVAFGGAFCAVLPGGEQSSKDLNFVNTVIFLPAFAFSALAENLNWTLLKSAMIVVAFSAVSFVISLVFGILCGKICCGSKWIHEEEEEDHQQQTHSAADRSLLDRLYTFCGEAWHKQSPADYKPLYELNLTLQNAGTFPLALLEALAAGGGTSWFGPSQNSEASNMIFVYQSVVALYYWTVGLWLVKKGKRLRTKQLELYQQAQHHQRSREQPAAEEPFHCESHDDLSQAVVQDVRETLAMVREGENNFDLQVYNKELPQPPATTTTAAAAAVPTATATTTSTQKWTRASILQFLLGLNLPLSASIAGMCVALVPGFHWLCYKTPLSLLTGSISMIGKGGVPVSLLVLGSNLTSSGLKPMRTMDARFLIVGNVMVTFVVPACKFAVFVFVDSAGMLSSLALHVKFCIFVELVAPTAIVASVICRLQDYMAETTAGFLMVQYILAVVSSSFWLWVFLLYTGAG